ncbi:MAG: hypothetical protein QMD21_06065, partial [Candidatus Thermoplasmatota archaeon]|nr:hypothetical protein [Candidatus Thermoplasmatota archaeon]
MLNVEERILDYVGRCYGERGQVPSVREILDDMNVSRYRFYLIFPNGIGGVCNALGLPIPMDGMRRTRSASDARRAKERKDLSEKYGDLHL